MDASNPVRKLVAYECGVGGSTEKWVCQFPRNDLVVLLDIVLHSYVYWTVHHLDIWVKRDQLDVTCFIISLYMLNMFRMLIHPSSGACDLCVELFRGLHWSGSMWFQHTSNQINVSHEITQHISRKLLRMDVLTFETCWALYKEQVTSRWPLFTQL